MSKPLTLLKVTKLSDTTLRIKYAYGLKIRESIIHLAFGDMSIRVWSNAGIRYKNNHYSFCTDMVYVNPDLGYAYTDMTCYTHPDKSAERHICQLVEEAINVYLLDQIKQKPA